MEVRLLGPFEVAGDDGTIVRLRGSKLRSLAALLAIDAGRVVSNDGLIECIYGDEPPLQASYYDDAEADLTVALDHLSGPVNLHNRSLCLGDLGRTAQARGDPASAVRRHAEAVRTAARMSDPVIGRSALEGLALAVVLAGDPARAGRALGAAGTLGALGSAGLARAQKEGETLPLEDLLAGL